MVNRLRGAVFGLVFVLGMTACTPGNPTTTEKPSSRAEHASAERPKDRDSAAVVAALRRIDFCAVARNITGSTSASAYDPFSCNSSGVSVNVVELSTDMRLQYPVRVIGGAKAYVDDTTPDKCVVRFPISFRLVLEVRGAGCAPAVNVTLGATPRWDACGALAKVLGDRRGKLYEAGVAIGAACERGEPSLAHLDFAFDNRFFGPTETEVVGAVQVTVQTQQANENPSGRPVCWMTWPSGTGNPQLWTTVGANSCADARNLAQSVMTVVASPPPDVAPQDPVLYGPDEPDTPYPGACAHLGSYSTENCRPYTDTRVPEDKTALLHADADTQCAVARNTVTRHLGGSLVPVAITDGVLAFCYFVEPERQVQVRFDIESDPIDGVREIARVHEATIAGHPAYVAENEDGYEIWVAFSDRHRGGGLHLAIQPGPARRDGQLPADADDTAESIIADILATYFS